MNKPKPQIGQICEVYGQKCVIIDVEDYGSFGNIVVETVDSKRNYRLTGLLWTKDDDK